MDGFTGDLQKVLSGAYDAAFGWRVMYGVARVLMIGLVLEQNPLLPTSQPSITLPNMIHSMWHLTRERDLLR